MANKEATLTLRIKEAGSEAIKNVGEAFDSLKIYVLAAAAAIIGFGIKAVAEFRNAELASNRLDQALAQQGIYTKELSNEYKLLAAELQKKSMYDDDAIKTAMASVQSHIGQIKITKELTTAILDFASAQEMDVVSAAQLVGKSIGSSTNALARYGIEIDSTGSKSDKTAQLIQNLNTKFGGQAQAAAQGLGSLTLLKNTFGDLMEVVGEQLSPIVTFFTNKLINLTEALQTNKGLLSELKTGFSFVSTGIVQANGVLEIAYDVFTRVLKIAGAVGYALTGRLSEAWELYKNATAGSLDAIADISVKTYSDLQELSKQNTDGLVDQEIKKQERLKEISDANKARILEEEAAHASELASVRALSDEQLQIQTLENQKNLLNQEQQNEKDHSKFLDIELKKRETQKKLEDARYRENQRALISFNRWVDDNHVKDKQDTFSRIEGLTQSNNQVLVSIGRAAALANIAISTSEGVARALGAFPPPFNFAAAAAVGAAGAVQASKVMGVKLAEGGIIQASPGGTAAIIGEGGRDEAVIPLGDDRASSLLGSTNNININVYGGLLGDQSSAREFALAIDQELYKLKRNNESLMGA